MGGTDIHYTKEKWNGLIHFGLPRAKQTDKEEAFPIPKTQDLPLKLEGFQYATSLDVEHGLLPNRVITIQPRAMYDSTTVG